MDSSSDESFAWTNASNSSDSSVENQNMTKHNGTVNGLDEDSDYGDSYKKKLHKKLLINNDLDDSSYQETKKEKKVKRKRTDDEDMGSPRNKKIKLEPDSDKETPKKKKKKPHDHSLLNETNDGSIGDISQDHSDLNITIKQEPDLISPKRKSKKQRKSETNESLLLNNDEPANETLGTNCTVENDESYVSKKKKKKSKKNQSSQSDNDRSTEMEINEDNDSYSHYNDLEQIQDSKQLNLKNEFFPHKVEVASESKTTDDNKSDLSREDDPSNTSNLKSKSKNKSTSNSSSIIEKPNKRDSSISEKIKFEGNNSQRDCSINNEVENTTSRKLKKFLKINGNLRQASTKQQGDWVLSPNDEVWAIQCPQDIDINAFLGVNIKLDRKCKIKVEGQTYEGTMNDETDSFNLLSLENKKYKIKKIPLKGTLHLRKKIPKVHIQDNNAIPDNDSDFVPLPVIKSRHPLFGSNYKKAIKVPNAIAERLKNPYNDTICDNESKKSKKKKHKNKSMEIDIDQAEEVQGDIPINDESIKLKKKNRKRKHGMDNEQSNSKRVKHNADSTTVWESEQAIEENLFNF